MVFTPGLTGKYLPANGHTRDDTSRTELRCHTELSPLSGLFSYASSASAQQQQMLGSCLVASRFKSRRISGHIRLLLH